MVVDFITAEAAIQRLERALLSPLAEEQLRYVEAAAARDRAVAAAAAAAAATGRIDTAAWKQEDFLRCDYADVTYADVC